jgi:hypothetical protein
MMTHFMKQLIPLVFSLLITTTIFSQNKTDKVTLTITPTTLIDPQPHLRVGTDFCINNIIASCDFGYGRGNMGWGWSKDFRFYEVRPELKFYVFRKLYLGTEVFRYKVTDVSTDGYYMLPNSNTTIQFSQADYERRQTGFTVKVGLRIMAASRFNIEFYGGVRRAFDVVSYKNVQNPVATGEGPPFEEWFGPTMETHAGNSSQTNLSLGIKLGYVIVKQTPRKND